MESFEQIQAEFLDIWVKKEGATAQTIEDYKDVLNRFKGLLKYRGLTDNLSRVDASIVDHFGEMLEEKGIARVDLEKIKIMLRQFVEYARAKSVAEKAPGPKQKEEPKPAKKERPKKQRVTTKLGLLVFCDLVLIAAVVYFLYVTPNLAPNLFRTLIVVLIASAVFLIIGLYRLFVTR